METSENTLLEAQQRADRISAFNEELDALQSQNILTLTDTQIASLTSYHRSLLSELKATFDIDHNSSAKQLSLGMKIVSLLGALAMASGIFYMFFQFWGIFSTTTQVAVLATSSVVSFIAVFIVAKKDQSGYYGKIMALISYACFVLNVVMLGKIFSLTPSPNAFLLWSFFAFVLAYMCKARVLLVFAILNFASFLSMYFGTFWGIYFLSFGERPENILFSGVLVFSIPFLMAYLQKQSDALNIQALSRLNKYTDFNKVYRVMGLLFIFLPILTLSNRGSGSYLNLASDSVEVIYQTLGFVLAGLTIFLGIRMQWRHVNTTGNIFFVLFLFTKFFDWWWDLLPKYVFFFLIGAVSIGLLVLLKTIRQRHKKLSHTEVLA